MADPIDTANITIASDLDYVIGNKSAGGNLATKQVTKGNFAAALVAQMKSDAIFLPPFMVVARGGTRWQGMADYIADGVADDVTIETAAAALDAAGGGILYIAPGSYYMGTGGAMLTTLTNVHVLGGGGRSTRLIKESGFSGNAAIALLGCSACSIRGIYVDSNGQDGNGITVGPTSPGTATGPQSGNCDVADCWVELQAEEHNYGIYFLQVQGGRIVNNIVDGMSELLTGIMQDGIETFGSSDIEIAGNRIRNINGDSIAIVNFPGYDAPTRNINAHHNIIDNCVAFWWINASQGAIGGGTVYTNDLENVKIEHNIASGIKLRGGYFAINSGSGDSGLVVKDVTIAHNTCTFAEDAELGLYQAMMFTAQANNGDPADQADFSTVNIRHLDNVYDRVIDAQFGLSIQVVSDVESRSNKYIGRADGAYEGALGAFVWKAPGARLISETFRNVQTNGIIVSDLCSNVHLEDNLVDNFDMDDLGFSVVSFETGSSGSGVVVKDNLCDTTDNPSVNFINFGSPASITEWWIGGNRTRSATLTVSYEYYPVATMGANGNRGQYTMAGGATTITVNSKHCMVTSNVSVRQRSGTPQAVTLVTPAAGSFVATLAAATNGSVYDWHIN